MKTFPRAERVGDLVMAALSRAILREAKDPRLRTVNITEVRMSPDLRYGRVFYNLLSETAPTERDRKRAGRALESAIGFFRGYLARDLELKYVPDLAFEFDDSEERGRRIEQLLEQELSDTADDGEEE